MLTVFKRVSVVVADDIAHLGLFHMTLDTQQMVETLITLCGLRRLVLWQHVCQLCSQSIGINHFPFGIARMYADAFDGDLCTGGIEVLKFQFAHIAAVHRIGPFATELLHVKVVGTHTDFLIGVKGDADIAVLDLLVIAQVAHRLDNLSDACLVVGA